MTHTVLHIDASANQQTSVSRAASMALVAQQKADKVLRLDLAQSPLPQITGDWASARLVPANDQTDSHQALLAQSDALVADLIAADTIVIGMPVYNFGMPAALKAWIDLVARPKLTFEYTPEGPKGLLKDKKVIVTVASGGTQIGSDYDYATPHLRFVLGFLGLTDVTFVAAADLANAA